MDKLKHKIPPPVFAVACALIMFLMASYWPNIIIPSTVKFILLVFFISLGLVFDILALMTFRRSHTTINPLVLSKTSSLVCNGIYRVSRNPMYVGLLLLLVAWGIYLESLYSLVMLFIFVFIINYFQIIPEESALENIFGEEYRQYKRKVRRWL